MARVTVINDSAEFLELMQAVLAELGHESTCMEAVEASIGDVVESRPDLLIVDLRLENTAQQVSGWELLLLARSHHDLHHVPAILCTGDLLELKKRKRDLARLANVHVLTKPFDMEQLSELVQPLLNEPLSTRVLPQAIVPDPAHPLDERLRRPA